MAFRGDTGAGTGCRPGCSLGYTMAFLTVSMHPLLSANENLQRRNLLTANLLQKLQTPRVCLEYYSLSYNGRSGFPTQTLGYRACLIIATPPGCPLLQSGGFFVLMINGVIIIYHLIRSTSAPSGLPPN